jgi:hypothetical protein
VLLSGLVLRRSRLLVALLLTVACARVGFAWQTDCSVALAGVTFAVGTDEEVRIEGLPVEGPSFEVRL